MFWDKKIETLSGKDLEALQSKRLKKTINQALKIPFYKKQFERAKIKGLKIKTTADITKIPFTKKQDLREGYPFGFLAVPLKDVVRIHTTSGTTGKPTVVGYTKNDLAAWAGLIARNMRMVGVKEGDVFQNMVNYGMFTGGLGFHYGAELLGVTVVPSATGNTKRQIEMIHDFGVTVIHCTPSYAMHLSEVAEETKADLGSLRIGMFGAEPWSEAMRKALESRLGVTAFDSYGLSELFGPGVAFECPERDGLHIWHDSYLVEIIDPLTGEQLSDGERGELVVTPLVKEAMPLLRYRTGDVTMKFEDGCLCRRGQKIGRITGRSDDMLVIRGINVFPSQIEHVLLKIPEVGNQFMVYVDRVNHLDEMTVEAEINRDYFSGELADLARIQKKVVKELRDALELRTTVKLVEPGSLPRFEGKAKRVIDRRGDAI
ncbi:MAG: long-chain-fatty-acid--CoA ligase [Methanoregula sp. PtaU1.Bin051]|nr:MAG: long-chain-fatty-acid--CoA ligase [Methanoregula sp. PtaU1.Bin051]